MAVVQKMFKIVANSQQRAYTNLGGAALANGDQSVPMEVPATGFEMAVQVTGTFGAAGSVQVERSNDAVNWVILAAGDVKSGTHPFTAAGLVEFATSARYLRLNVTAGDGTTALFVTITNVGQRS